MKISRGRRQASIIRQLGRLVDNDGFGPGRNTISDMLLLLQAVAQQLPPIQVTVQQPPGAPVWVTTLISASVGAALALGTSIALEYVKPLINNNRTKRRMVRDLVNEFKGNYAMVLDAAEAAHAYRTGNPLQKVLADMMITSAAAAVGKTVYSHYKETELSLFLEVERESPLWPFYGFIDMALKTCRENTVFMDHVVAAGRDFMEKRHIDVEALGMFAKEMAKL